MAARKVDFLLIGGGLASANCARWLRESGSDGEVMLARPPVQPPRLLQGIPARRRGA